MKIIYEKNHSYNWRDYLNARIAKYVHSLSDRNSARRGTRMVIFANDQIGIQINQFGIYEEIQLQTLFNFLNHIAGALKDGTVLDVGANIGNHSVYFARHAGQVLSFEPHPLTFELLRLNVRTLDNVSVFRKGLGERRETLQLYEHAHNMGASSVVPQTSADAVSVPIVIETLDEQTFAPDGAPAGRDIVMMKIDVEGFEEQVLTGASATIAQHQPVIILEQHRGQFSGHAENNPCITLLTNHGYRFCWHRQPRLKRVKSLRWLARIQDMMSGAVHQIVCDEAVPVDNYPMLIAIPPRFQDTLMSRKC